jgi:lysophospholipid acyltransferase (LPLAT)-like uncharacterized protein
MVRLINSDNIGVVKNIINGYMQFQKYHTHIVEINNKHLRPCIYAMWHADQFCVYGLREKARTSILISTSIDGDIVAYCCENLGFKTVRGSSGRRGAIESALKMAELLQNGEDIAIMVDGPHGPLHTVKNGVVRLAKMSGAPIVPVGWYCKQFNFVRLPSWDSMWAPISDCNIINLYGEPIYVPKDISNEEEAEYRRQIKESLDDIHARLPEEYKLAKKNKLWKEMRAKK